jgi:hypothetical protein
MASRCTICNHKDRLAIDREIIAGLPYRDISGRWELSKSAVERHASSHLADAIARDHAAAAEVTSRSLVAELRVLRETTLGVLEEARADGNGALALRAIERLEKQAELVGRLAGELVDRQVVEERHVLVDRQWLELRRVILSALKPFPDAVAVLRKALAGVDRVPADSDGPDVM